MSAFEQQPADCFVCRKHRGEISVPGEAVYEDDWVYAGHASIPDGQSTAYLGALLVEPKRHVPGLGDLNDAEAQTVGLLIARLSRALKASEGAEHVYLFRLGHHVSHLHIWVVPRYPDTPREYWGIHVDEWPDAPRGASQEIAALCARLRAYLKNEGHQRR